MQYQGLPLLPDLPALLRRGAAPDGLGKYDAELAQFKDSLLKDGGPHHSLDPAEVLTPLPPVPSGPSQLVVRRRSSIAVGAGLGSSSSSSSSRRPLRRPKHPSHEAERSTETIRQAIARAQVQQAGEDGLRISYDERRGVLSVGVPGRATFRARLQPDTESLASRTICTRVTQEQSMLHTRREGAPGSYDRFAAELTRAELSVPDFLSCLSEAPRFMAEPCFFCSRHLRHLAGLPLDRVGWVTDTSTSAAAGDKSSSAAAAKSALAGKWVAWHAACEV